MCWWRFLLLWQSTKSKVNEEGPTLLGHTPWWKIIVVEAAAGTLTSPQTGQQRAEILTLSWPSPSSLSVRSTSGVGLPSWDMLLWKGLYRHVRECIWIQSNWHWARGVLRWGLNVKCPYRLMCLKAWLPAHGTVWGGVGTLEIQAWWDGSLGKNLKNHNDPTSNKLSTFWPTKIFYSKIRRLTLWYVKYTERQISRYINCIFQ